jgi:hypothetical protein
VNESCAALEWDKTRKDYVPCSPSGKTELVRLLGIICVELPLCAAHREVFEWELARYGGHLDPTPRVVTVQR